MTRSFPYRRIHRITGCGRREVRFIMAPPTSRRMPRRMVVRHLWHPACFRTDSYARLPSGRPTTISPYPTGASVPDRHVHAASVRFVTATSSANEVVGYWPADREYGAARIVQAADPSMLRHGVHELRG